MTHDMTTIVQPINLLVSDEYDRAAKLHGATFADAGPGCVRGHCPEGANGCGRGKAE